MSHAIPFTSGEGLPLFSLLGASTHALLLNLLTCSLLCSPSPAFGFGLGVGDSKEKNPNCFHLHYRRYSEDYFTCDTRHGFSTSSNERVSGKGSVPRDCSLPPLQMPVPRPSCHLGFRLTTCKSELPRPPSVGLINVVEQLRKSLLPGLSVYYKRM